MCPACIATTVLLAFGSASAGGLGLSLLKRARKKQLKLRPPECPKAQA